MEVYDFRKGDRPVSWRNDIRHSVEEDFEDNSKSMERELWALPRFMDSLYRSWKRCQCGIYLADICQPGVYRFPENKIRGGVDPGTDISKMKVGAREQMSNDHPESIQLLGQLYHHTMPYIEVSSILGSYPTDSHCFSLHYVQHLEFDPTQIPIFCLAALSTIQRSMILASLEVSEG